MADLPVKPEGQEIEDVKNSNVSPKEDQKQPASEPQKGVTVQLGNTEVIKIKLLEAIQNALIENNKLLNELLKSWKG